MNSLNLFVLVSVEKIKQIWELFFNLFQPFFLSFLPPTSSIPKKKLSDIFQYRLLKLISFKSIKDWISSCDNRFNVQNIFALPRQFLKVDPEKIIYSTKLFYYKFVLGSNT